MIYSFSCCNRRKMIWTKHENAVTCEHQGIYAYQCVVMLHVIFTHFFFAHLYSVYIWNSIPIRNKYSVALILFELNGDRQKKYY